MQPIIICFTCRQRVTEQDLRAGSHDHIDLQERARVQEQAQLANRD